MPVLAGRLSRAEVHVCVVNKLYVNSKNFHLQNVATTTPQPTSSSNWWFTQSPALFVSSLKGKKRQSNVFADGAQLEVDCLRRVDQLLTAHDCLVRTQELHGEEPRYSLPLTRSHYLEHELHKVNDTHEDAFTDQLAAFIMHQAVVSDPTADWRHILRLETDLFLLRTINHQQMDLFSLFGETCVPMKQEDMAPFERVLPADYDEDSWQHLFAVDFETATPLLATRKVLLHKGTAYFHADDVGPVLERLCAVSLWRYMSQMQQFLFANRNEQFTLINLISAQILSRLRRPALPALDTTNAQDLRLDTIVDTILWNAPLCIRALLVKLKDSHATLYRPKPGVSPGLNNDERFVLRNFLQACGVERNVTLELFRQRSGLDDKSFHGKYGRDIHGSYNKQTKCFGCAKIQDKGLCPFQDKQRASQVLKTTSPSDTHTVDIEDCYKSLPSTPSSACVALYNKRHGPRKCVYSPRSYFLDARAKRVRIEQPKAHSDLPPPSLIPATAERAARIKAVSMGQLPR